MRNRATIWANRALFRLVPPGVYLPLALWLIPLLDKRRRGMPTKVEPAPGGYVARNRNGTWHFNSAFKIGRYLYRDPADGIEQAMLAKYQDGEVTVEKGDLVIDIGANVGEFTVAAAGCGARVIAVEPDETAFACLTRNIARFGDVVCVDALVGDIDGSKPFYVSPQFSDSSVVVPTERWSQVREVRSLTIASLLSEQGESGADFLKLEAEGFEPEILKAAMQDLPRIRKVAIDASPERDGAATDTACRALLEANGFRVWQRGWMVFAINKKQPAGHE